jgi:hypothetical protein
MKLLQFLPSCLLQLQLNNNLSQNYMKCKSRILLRSTTEAASATMTATTRDDASQIIDTALYPTNKYNERTRVARDAQFSVTNPLIIVDDSYSANADARIISAADPRLTFTYDEFPMQSMDELVDLAIQEFKLHHSNNGGGDNIKPKTFVDLGSGCGRLVLYAALADNPIAWETVHGIELSQGLHDIGLKAIDVGIEQGNFLQSTTSTAAGYETTTTTSAATSTGIQLHRGLASDCANILSQADVVFIYSTVLETTGFNVDLGAMVLSEEWSLMLAQACKDDCIVITTDRALDPQHGWDLLHRRDVANPKLLGTTGYISKLRR